MRNPAGLWAGFTGANQVSGVCIRSIHGLDSVAGLGPPSGGHVPTSRARCTRRFKVPRGLCVVWQS